MKPPRNLAAFPPWEAAPASRVPIGAPMRGADGCCFGRPGRPFGQSRPRSGYPSALQALGPMGVGSRRPAGSPLGAAGQTGSGLYFATATAKRQCKDLTPRGASRRAASRVRPPRTPRSWLGGAEGRGPRAETGPPCEPAIAVGAASTCWPAGMAPIDASPSERRWVPGRREAPGRALQTDSSLCFLVGSAGTPRGRRPAGRSASCCSRASSSGRRARRSPDRRRSPRWGS